jgi:hypothetical protein
MRMLPTLGSTPVRHFLEYGEAEGRNPSGSFSTAYYRNTYMQAEPPDASPLRHFLRVGRILRLEFTLKYVQKVSIYPEPELRSRDT